MLGVPTEESAGKLYAPPPRAVEPGKPESPVAALIQLAEQVRAAIGEDILFAERDGELVVIHPAEPDQIQAQAPFLSMRKSEAGKVAVLLAVALVVLVGWEGRGALVSKTSRRAPYHPATLAEAHRFLAKHSVDPQLLVENRPFKNYSPKSVPDLNLGSPILDLPDNSRRPRGSFSTDQSFAPMPAPLDGQIGATLPNPSPLSIHKENSPVADLHGLEAKLRTCISAHGGRVIRVGESDGGESKSFYVSVATDEARSLMASVERNMGGRVSVSGPSEDDSSNEGIDSVKASEIKAAENSVASLKKQLDQDEISFLPEAPVLKSLRAQYAEARSQLSSLRRTAHPNSLIRVTLASG